MAGRSVDFGEMEISPRPMWTKSAQGRTVTSPRRSGISLVAAAVSLALIAGLLGVVGVPGVTGGSAAAQDDGAEIVMETAVSLGSVWSYLDDGSDQADRWVDPTFDDSSWSSGPGELGYGDGDEGTVVEFGGDPNDRHPTTYFRTSFEVADVYQIIATAAQIKRDDAAIVYLNGTEVWRSSNLPSVVDYQTFATGNAVEGPLDAIGIDYTLMQEGTNTLAVEVHNRGPANSDISFDFELTLDRDPAIPPGPRMAPDEFEVPAGIPLAGTVATNDLAEVTYSMDEAAAPDPVSEGTLTIGPDGAFSWTPAAQFAGTVVVAVTGCALDDPNFCGTTELAIDVLGVVADDDLAETAFDTPVSGNVGDNDNDQGNGELTWSVIESPDADDGEFSFAADGAWSFTPTPGFEGGVAVEYQACDAQGDCDTALLTVLVATAKLKLDFSRTRGFITDPVTVAITATDPDATILVSTSWGTEWLYDDFAAVAQPYVGPIQVNGSTQIRAVALTDDQRTDVESHTFIDISSYSANDQAKIRQYPVLEIPNLPAHNRSSDKVSLIEVFWPDDRHPGVSAPAGIRNRQGGTGQDGDFRLYFRGEYGDGRLDYDFFPDVNLGSQTSGKADKINFHGGSQDALSTSGGGCKGSGGTLMKDRFYQHLQTEMNGDGVNGQYYLMFSRGELVGVKNAEDVPHQGWHEDTYGGGEKSDFVLRTVYSNDGPFSDWNDAQGSSFSRFAQSVDVINYMDYHLVQWFAGNADWPGNNMVLGGRADGGPFYNWAYDMHLTDPGCPRVNTYFGTPPRNDSDFQMQFADRVLLHYQPGGPLTPDGLVSRWDALAAQLRPAVSLVASERTWESKQEKIRGLMSKGSSALLDALESADYASTVPPVSYSIEGGVMPSGTEVSLSGGSEIWFTVDGTDPRASGGAVSGSAQRYQDPVGLPDGTVQMLARAKAGDDWSAALPVIFQVGDGPGLVINEIHFNPADGVDGDTEVDGDEYEFIELANHGSTGVDLEYFRLQGGLRMKFDYNRSPVIGPGEQVVLARDAERFRQRYGFAPDGEYLGKLGNGGEDVRLVDTHLNTIDEVVFSDIWAPRADGEGPSLSFDGRGDNDLAESWARSANDGGTPGAPNVLAAPQAADEPGIILNEWNAVLSSRSSANGDLRLGSVKGNGGDWFELVVVNDHVDARGWRIVVVDDDGSELLILSDDPVWSDLRSGTIITVSEAPVVAEDGTSYGQDTSYDPEAGDWWIHAVAGVGGDAGLVSAVDFPVSADNWQATIFNASGDVQWGPVGEGIGALDGGVGKAEVGELEADPTPDLDPVTAAYDDGDASTFGLANRFDEREQNLGVLRSVVNAPPTIAPISDQDSITGDEISLQLAASDPEGDAFTWSAEGLPTGLTIDPNSGLIAGVVTTMADYAAEVSVTDGFGASTILFTWTVVDPEVAVAGTCVDESGTVTVKIFNSSGSFASYSVRIGSTPAEQRSISGGLHITIERSGLADGDVPVTVARNNAEIYNTPITLTCGLAPEPTATPAPPAPTPGPAPGGPGVVESVHATHTVTCLGGNGRVDTNIVNTGAATAEYRINFEGLSPRARDVPAGDWWRSPITGRPDRPYQIVVTRDGIVVSDTTVTVGCDADPIALIAPEVQVVNACRSGNGYILFQFANPTDANKAWVIEFEGVPNRSTSAQAYGASVRAVTGRPNGIHRANIRTGSTPVANFDVTVNC